MLVSPCGRWHSGSRGGSCQLGLGQSCQPSGEEFRRLRQGARRGSCREVRDRGRSQGTLPAAIGDRFDKDGTRERTLCQARKDSPKKSYTREVPSEKPNMERTEDVRIVTNILCQQVTYRINVLSPRVEMVSPA